VPAWAEAGADLILGGHIHLPYVCPLHEEQTRFGALPRHVWAVQAGTAVSHRVRYQVFNSVNVVRTCEGRRAAAGSNAGTSRRPPAPSACSTRTTWRSAMIESPYTAALLYVMVLGCALSVTDLAVRYWRRRRRLARDPLALHASADLMRLRLIATALLLFFSAALAVLTSPDALRLDRAVSDAAYAAMPAAVLHVLAVITHLGDSLTLTLICIVVGAVLLVRGRTALGLTWFAAIAGNGPAERDAEGAGGTGAAAVRTSADDCAGVEFSERAYVRLDRHVLDAGLRGAEAAAAALAPAPPC
jgi:hypothetical protein